MPVPLESDYLVPNATFIVVIFLVLVCSALLLGGLVWFLTSRRRTTADR